MGITKTKIGYTAFQYKGITNEVLSEAQLTEVNYKTVIKFEIEGKKANSPKGTTSPAAEFYSVELNKELTTFIIPVKWDGFTNLKEILIPTEQK